MTVKEKLIGRTAVEKVRIGAHSEDLTQFMGWLWSFHFFSSNQFWNIFIVNKYGLKRCFPSPSQTEIKYRWYWISDVRRYLKLFYGVKWKGKTQQRQYSPLSMRKSHKNWRRVCFVIKSFFPHEFEGFFCVHRLEVVFLFERNSNSGWDADSCVFARCL